MDNHHFYWEKSTISMENHNFSWEKSTISMENHNFSWENPLFLWKITIFLHFSWDKAPNPLGNHRPHHCSIAMASKADQWTQWTVDDETSQAWRYDG